jgi:hypothetical protein
MFPFGQTVPKKDVKKVLFDLVRVSSDIEFQLLCDYLLEKGMQPIQPEMKYAHARTLAIPLNPSDQTFGYVGIHVVASQVYHGAVLFESVQTYITKKV